MNSIKKSIALFAFLNISVIVIAQLNLTTELNLNNAQLDENFGCAAKMDNQGKRIIVGALGRRINQTRQGAAYIYIKECEEWTQEVELISPTGNFGDVFGTAVSISGNGKVAAVGAPDKGFSQGSVYIYTRTGTDWSTNPIELLGAGDNDKFGLSVDLNDDGTRLVVGASLAGGGTAENRVVIYDFNSDLGTWNEDSPQVLTQPNGGPGAGFGQAVAISGNGKYIVVGALSMNGGGYIFEKVGNEWNLVYTQAGNSGAQLGNALAINGNGSLAIIGAHQHIIDGISVGAIFIIERQENTWQQVDMIYPTSAEGDDEKHFASSVAISDDSNWIIVGAQEDSFNDGNIWRAGSAYLYSYQNNTWNVHPKLTAGSYIDEGVFFGSSVAINAYGDRAGVGALNAGENSYKSGAAYMFEDCFQDNVETNGNNGEDAELSIYKHWSEIIKNLATVLGILLAGFWTLYLFNLFREKFPSIELKNDIRFIGESETQNLFELICVITNKGKVRKWLAPLEFECLGLRKKDLEEGGIFPTSENINNEVRFRGLNKNRQEGEYHFSKMPWVKPIWTFPFVDGQASRQFQYIIGISKDFEFISLYTKFIDYKSKKEAIKHQLEIEALAEKPSKPNLSKRDKIKLNMGRKSDFYFAQITHSVKKLKGEEK